MVGPGQLIRQPDVCVVGCHQLIGLIDQTLKDLDCPVVQFHRCLVVAKGKFGIGLPQAGEC